MRTTFSHIEVQKLKSQQQSRLGGKGTFHKEIYFRLTIDFDKNEGNT